MKSIRSTEERYNIGSYKGFEMYLSCSLFSKQFTLDLKREGTHSVTLGDSDVGNMQRIDNVLDSIEKRIEGNKEQLHRCGSSVKKPKWSLQSLSP